MDAIVGVATKAFPRTHRIHIQVFVAALCVNVFGLLWLNRTKAKGYVPEWTWTQKRRLYWSYLLAVIAGNTYLERKYPINELFWSLKAYSLVFPFGMIDYYFSENTHVSIRTWMGAGLWGSSLWLRHWAMRTFIAPNLVRVVTDFSAISIGKELLRFAVSAVPCSMFTDLIFSPMHRLEHKICYAQHHKEHHSYTNKINSLVLYHGAFLDDFMMPFTMTIGYFVYAKLCASLGLASAAYSNLSEWLLVFNTLLSHAHDERCAGLMLPVPDSLNFATYHRVHHINPARNFGLTLPSDIIWDKILGVNTICMDTEKAAKDAKHE